MFEERRGSGLQVGSVRLKWPDRCSHMASSAIGGGNSFTHMLNGGTTGNAWKNRQRMESKCLSAGAESAGTLSGPVVGALQMRHNRVKTLSSALY